MKTSIRWLKRSLIILIGLVVLLLIVLFYVSHLPAVPKNYVKKQKPGGEIEAVYAQMGMYDVTAEQFEVSDQGHFKVWYPTQTGQYPLVVMVNGTGVPYQKYEALFEHLASWGFVVIGNDAEMTWDGSAASLSLSLALSNTAIASKVDASKIGIMGHSQGGEGALNAVLEYPDGASYQTVVALSPTSNPLAVSLGWCRENEAGEAYGYDLSRLQIPVLMLAGTGSFDADTVIPLNELQANLEALPLDTPYVGARRKNTEHGQILWQCDGYVTAWLRYWLHDDPYAGQAFFGTAPELLDNPEYQDIMVR